MVVGDRENSANDNFIVKHFCFCIVSILMVCAFIHIPEKGGEIDGGMVYKQGT